MNKGQSPYKFQPPQATPSAELPKNKYPLGPPKLYNKRPDPSTHMKFPPSAGQRKGNPINS